jgi:hypothetical protein
MTQDTAAATLDIDRPALPRNPVESTALRMRAMDAGNGITPTWPAEKLVTSRSRYQPYATREEDARRSQGPG